MEVEMVKRTEAGMRLNREAVADEIERRLTAAGKTQIELSRDSGISQSSLSDILNHKQNLTIAQAYRLGRVKWLKVSAIRLMALAIKGLD
jgi:transcriptional regulator with XRE-family HTH domain